LRQRRRLSNPPQPGQCLMRRDGDYSIPQSTVPLIAITAPKRGPPAGSSSMRENVLLGPALEVKQRTIWQEIEASPGQLDAVLPGQHRIETAA
jgi:hypothetical protein